MPAKVVPDDQLLASLVDRFRADGYEGVTLSALQDATGLRRASLYHRFPGGKQDMALAVVDAVARRFAEVVLAPAHHDRPLEERVRHIGRRLGVFYADGALSCLLETMSTTGTPEAVRDRVAQTMRTWIDVFTALAIEGGATPAAARIRATDAISALEGGLIVARTGADRSAFARAVTSLPSRLLD